MMLFPNLQEIRRFRAQIAAMMGLYFDESKFPTLARVLHNRMLAHESDHSCYLDWLDVRVDDEIRALARELTVTETYFLRNIEQFHAFSEVAVPGRLAMRDGKIDVLSAGCASGEEPYSMAIAIREYCPYAADRIAISALDLNPAMLQKAQRAHYSNWSLRDLSDEIKKRWFKVEGDTFTLNEEIRKAVVFESCNLSQDAEDFWIPGRFDIVFCRNVLMYFSPDQARAAVQRIARSMAPGGFLFLGHAETLRGLSNDFHLCHTNDTFYYQRKEQLVSSHVDEFAALPHRLSPLPLADISWVDAIQRASDRIHALTPALVAKTVEPEGARYNNETATPNIQRVLESLHREKYDRSLNQIEDLLIGHARDPDILLLKAVSLSLSGALTAAGIVCEELLSCDECNAGAHYVLALCKEGTGDLEGAFSHDHTAAYLDPRFAMPRLHLGLLARRQNNRDSARNHLEQALVLLHQEDASRVLLFGGGFKREALLGLCSAELAALGENK
jgi:chemotaxis protein methyltransferase CheR